MASGSSCGNPQPAPLFLKYLCVRVRSACHRARVQVLCARASGDYHSDCALAHPCEAPKLPGRMCVSPLSRLPARIIGAFVEHLILCSHCAQLAPISCVVFPHLWHPAYSQLAHCRSLASHRVVSCYYSGTPVRSGAGTQHDVA